MGDIYDAETCATVATYCRYTVVAIILFPPVTALPSEMLLDYIANNMDPKSDYSKEQSDKVSYSLLPYKIKSEMSLNIFNSEIFLVKIYW